MLDSSSKGRLRKGFLAGSRARHRQPTNGAASSRLHLGVRRHLNVHNERRHPMAGKISGQ